MGDFSAPYVPGELLVLPGGLTPQGLTARVAGARVEKPLEGGFLKVRVPEGKERAKAWELLQAGARWAQPNYLYFPLYTPNDPLYPASPLDPSRLQPYYQAIRLEAAWNLLGPLPCTPVVAVLDTAFNPKHEDMGGVFLSGYNATPDGLPKDNLDPSPPPSGFAYDPNKDAPDHGQGVAGLVAAVADNNRGIPGVGLNRVKVLPVKVFYWVWGEYSSTSEVLAAAIRYAADQGAAVANLSLGSSAPLDGAVQQALGYALSKGTLPVAAAGNVGVEGLDYPAAYPGVLAVGSARLNGTRSDFSNYSTQPKDLVLAAAGNNNPPETLWSLALDKNYAYYQSLGAYAKWLGTSFAAPQASALAALYVAKHYARYGQGPSPDQIRLCLTRTASNGGSYNPETGYGLLRADRVMTDTTYCFP
ncbi:peptidase S8 [Thermus scotoductus]|uniref:Peptidase S8 n=2 Tax=Thermus scotoductus TaxID=37636 RepID=A0A430VTK0_THESC|nr:peptidase S8 [Thermus scotoductus]